MRREGFSLIELMVVVAILAIIASIAMPMYSNFRARAMASTPSEMITQMKGGLIAYYQERGTYAGITRAANGALTVSGDTIGLGIPNTNDISWGAVESSGNSFRISWSYLNNKCNLCAGRYCITCNSGAGSCSVALTFVNGIIADKLNHNREGITCPAP